MIYITIKPEDEMPPDVNNEWFIVRMNGLGSAFEDEVDELTGHEIHMNVDYIKVWFKPIKIKNPKITYKL